MRRMRNGFSVLIALVWLASSFLAIYSHNNPTYIALATDIHGAFKQHPVILGKSPIQRGRQSLTRICNTMRSPIDDIFTGVDNFSRTVALKRVD